MKNQRLVVIDALSCLYRFFFAIRGLSGRDKEPTNALFGMLRFLDQIVQEWDPEYWVVIFDGGVPKERRALLPQYKANRPPMPPDLKSQLPLVEEFLDRAGIPRIRVEGEEADDLIASMALRARREGCPEIYLATADKDMFQLVDENIKVLPPSGMLMNSAEVRKKTGVSPCCIVDWLSLRGDSSDNIPGVPGVGEKTAASLLDHFGSIKGIYDRLDEVERERIRAALGEHRAVVDRNLQLVKLRTDLELPVKWQDASRKAIRREEVEPFLERHGLMSFLKKLREQGDLFVRAAVKVKPQIMEQATFF
jgi:DNA polymerase I